MLKMNDEKFICQVLACCSRSSSVGHRPAAQTSPLGGDDADSHWPAILTCHSMTRSSCWSYIGMTFPLSPPLPIKLGRELAWVLCKIPSSTGRSYSTGPRWGWQVRI